MKKLFSVLFVSLLTITLSGNALAKPTFGNNCGACHGVPAVTAFDLPASHDSLTVPIVGFTAKDTDPQKSNLAGIDGYMLTTSSAAPAAGDPAWQSSPPSQYVFASDGLQTLYAWVKDSLGIVSATVSDAVDILIATNAAPMADAGPDQTVEEGVTVTLNGSNSDDSDDGIAGYLWEQVGGSLAVVLSNPTAENPTFDTPNVGTGGAALTFRLTVTDMSGVTDTDTTIVNISWVNVKPVADAGSDQTVAEGTLVTLNGGASDGIDDGIANYSWNQVDISGVIAVLSDSAVSNPQFTITDVSADGHSLTFELTVTDEGGLQATDRCVINVTNVNKAPVADAGADQTVMAGEDVMLDGSGSYDPDNDINPDNGYIWKQTAGTSITLSSPSAVKPVFTTPALAAGSSETMVFELTVTDSGLLKATDTCEIQVNGETPPVEEPPVEEPPVEEPPVIEPPVEEPPVEEPPVIEPPVEEQPSEDLINEYKRLAKEYLTTSKALKQKSKEYDRLYRINRRSDHSAAQDYLTQALQYKAQSLDAKWEAGKYLQLYKQAKKQSKDVRHHGDHDDDEDEEKRAHDDDHDDDRDRDRDREHEHERERERDRDRD